MYNTCSKQTRRAVSTPVPNGSTNTAETRSFDWRPNYQTRKTALFRVYPGYAVLQHVRTVTVSQRAASTCEIDDEPSLDDVPKTILEGLRATGRDLVAGGRA